LDEGNRSFENVAQIVSHFAKKFELSKRAASTILEEVAVLACQKPRRPAPLSSQQSLEGSRRKAFLPAVNG
jgi:hypothetical protein